jgi:hypothetical protein
VGQAVLDEGRQTLAYAAQCGSVRVDARQCSISATVARAQVHARWRQAKPDEDVLTVAVEAWLSGRNGGSLA